MIDYLSLLDRHACPACAHSRAVRPVGCDDPQQHALTQGQARQILRQLGCSLPAGRPRHDPAAARVRVSYRVHPDTAALIDAEAKRTGDGAGQVLDRLAQTLR